MKNIRKRIACFLLFVFCISNSVTALAVEEGQKEEQSYNTVLNATVAGASASYVVEIPDSVSLGSLDSRQDMNYAYTVRVTMENEDGTDQVTVASDKQISLHLSGDDREKAVNYLPCYNDFDTHTFTKSGSADGALTIHKEDIAKAKSGQYAGILNFYITYQTGQIPPEQPDVPVEPEPTTPPDDTVPPPSVVDPPIANNGGSGSTRYVSDVSMRKGTDFSSISMCNALFFGKADIVTKGDMATLTLYVIDPVPSFASSGTPLKNVVFKYNGKSYPASVRSGGKVMKRFNAAPGFISEAGEYAATPVTVQIPMQALKDSLDGKLMCSAYITTVMQTTQEFYVVLSNMVQVSSPTSGKPATGVAPDASEETMPEEETTVSTETGNETTPDSTELTDNQAQEEPQYVIVTKLFPALLGFILFTSLIMGTAFCYLWYRRK